MTLEEIRADYERQVRGLAKRVVSLRAEGLGAEAIAREVHAARRGLAAKFKALTPEPHRTRIRARTIAVYGDPLGPRIEDLRTRGKSWEEIIEGAIRPGPGPALNEQVEGNAGGAP